jgi:co-chaperonin GroES (HSP10)
VDYYVPNGTPQGTTEPASAARINIKPLADRVVVEPAPAEERQIAYNAGVEGAIIAERRGKGNVVVIVEPAPAEERQIAYNAGVEGAIIVERRGNVLVVGNFTPTHVALPMPELELDPGDGPVCGIPGPLGQGEETVDSTARYTGYVLNQAIATGPRPSGKTLGAVTRQAPPQAGNQNMGQAIRQQLADLGAEVEVHRMAGPISLPRPSDVGLPEFRMMPRGRAVSVPIRDEIRTALVELLRMMPPGGGAPVLWPNGNPPRDPDWPWVGVIGTPVLEGIEGEPGPGKPQNWCGTEYIWTGPRPKSPKELILTPVIPRPR